MRVEVVARAELLEERAAQRLLGLVARLGDGDLGEGRDSRHVKVFAGVGRSARGQHQHGAQLLAAGDDRHLGGHVAGPLGAAAGQARRDVALVCDPRLDARAQPRHNYHGPSATSASVRGWSATR